LTTPTNLPNPALATGSFDVMSGAAEIGEGIEEGGAAPVVSWYDAGTRVVDGAWDVNSGIQDLGEAAEHPLVCTSPLHWGVTVASKLGIDYAGNKVGEAFGKWLNPKYWLP